MKVIGPTFSKEKGVMVSRTSVSIVTVVLIAAALIGAVLLLGDDEARPGRDGRLEILVEDSTLNPSSFTLPAGEPITLVFESRNEFTQNLTIGRSVIEEGGVPVSFREDLLAGLDAEVEPRTAWIEPTENFDLVTMSVAPQTTVTVELTVPRDRAGDWQVGCFHGNSCDYQVGTAGSVTVE